MRSEVPMRRDSGLELLIVDNFKPATYNLRTSLLRSGHHVHVVSSLDMALLLAHRKRIHMVFLEFSPTEPVGNFCAQLDQLAIPHIFMSPGDEQPILLMGPSYTAAKSANELVD